MGPLCRPLARNELTLPVRACLACSIVFCATFYLSSSLHPRLVCLLSLRSQSPSCPSSTLQKPSPAMSHGQQRSQALDEASPAQQSATLQLSSVLSPAQQHAQSILEPVLPFNNSTSLGSPRRLPLDLPFSSSAASEDQLVSSLLPPFALASNPSLPMSQPVFSTAGMSNRLMPQPRASSAEPASGMLLAMARRMSMPPPQMMYGGGPPAWNPYGGPLPPRAIPPGMMPFTGGFGGHVFDGGMGVFSQQPAASNKRQRVTRGAFIPLRLCLFGAD